MQRRGTLRSAPTHAGTLSQWRERCDPCRTLKSAISGSKKLSRGIAFFKIHAHFAISLDLQRDFPDPEQEIP
jgi:hypothetical protein